MRPRCLVLGGHAQLSLSHTPVRGPLPVRSAMMTSAAPEPFHDTINPGVGGNQAGGRGVVWELLRSVVGAPRSHTLPAAALALLEKGLVLAPARNANLVAKAPRVQREVEALIGGWGGASCAPTPLTMHLHSKRRLPSTPSR